MLPLGDAQAMAAEAIPAVSTGLTKVFMIAVPLSGKKKRQRSPYVGAGLPGLVWGMVRSTRLVQPCTAAASAVTLTSIASTPIAAGSILTTLVPSQPKKTNPTRSEL